MSGTRSQATPGTYWTLDRVAAALEPLMSGNPPRGSTALSGISTDTRGIAPGNLFVALSGEHFDAHDFLPAAVEGGAAALVVSRPERTSDLGVPVYAVEDPRQALGMLARDWRRAWNGPVIAVAGSNGKTTTKEMIRAALARRMSVHATEGNFNNLVGVPLTLLAIPSSAHVAVVELGTNVPGEVAQVRALAEPDVTVVTSVGEEHLEGLGSLEQILKEETSAYEGARVGIAPASQPEIVEVARRLCPRVVVAGMHGGDLPVTGWGSDQDGRGWFEVDGVRVVPPVRGAHNLRNAALAMAVAHECGVPYADAAAGIASMPVPSMRTAWERLGGAVLINDAYNANPPSMRAAIDLLASLGNARQRVAVLGGMRELGEHAARLHAEVARYALAAPLELIAGMGDMASALRAEGAGDERLVTASDVEELWQALAPRLAPDCVILLKASRGIRLERLVPHLTDWASRACSPG